MRVRGNIILQYSVATFVIILVVSVVLGRLLVGQITDYQLRSHIRLYPELIDLAVKGNPSVYDMFQTASGGPVRPSVESLLRSFFGLGTIFRVKVWSRDGTIVWSDQRDEIGQKFPGDDPLVEALQTGRAAYELGESEKEENVSEKDKGSLLQVYTPVTRNSIPVGVIELYEANIDLFGQIARSTLFVEGAVAAAGLLLYAALFIIFFRAYQRQKRANEERNRVLGVFGQHVSPEVVNQLLSQNVDQDGEKRRVCLMFLDIRNFTAMTEKSDPVVVVGYLNSLFEFMVDCVNRNQGIVNKFLGDGFMAVFGAPIPDEKNCYHALKASIEILNQLGRFNASRPDEPTRVGIGLHAGLAVTGTIGSAQRKEYTIVGDTVNVAKRIEELNKSFGSRLLVSEEVWNELATKPRVSKKVGRVRVRGREAPILLYQVA
ncbi:MAG TPA: adenylate/guanylate cyclase domain-containing protein [Spirochaetia bacterium]|nr:adenylate/guanylate cyclase domain-containing protein [Spirochaetia bacterium]